MYNHRYVRIKYLKSRLSQAIEDAKKIAIFSHVNPDADALCSAFALKNIINNNFDLKFVDVFIDGKIGELYDPIMRNEVINPKPYVNYDLAFVLDCPNLQRIGQYKYMTEHIPTIINIDHHETNSKFGTINSVGPKVSSTCEIIYWIARSRYLELNNLIAKELYQGIITDTNCFTSMSITPRTHKAVSELMKFKFDADMIKTHYFRNNSVAKTKLLSKALESMKFYNNDKFTTMKIDYNTFKSMKASFEDTLGIIDNGMNISKTEVSAIFIESEPEYIHCSLRSRGNINVGAIAKEFNGGGSTTLAAFQAHVNISDLEKHLVTAISPKLPTDSTDNMEILF
jgi:phosphoesterase RecJ-like protein